MTEGNPDYGTTEHRLRSFVEDTWRPDGPNGSVSIGSDDMRLLVLSKERRNRIADTHRFALELLLGETDSIGARISSMKEGECILTATRLHFMSLALTDWKAVGKHERLDIALRMLKISEDLFGKVPREADISEFRAGAEAIRGLLTDPQSPAVNTSQGPVEYLSRVMAGYPINGMRGMAFACAATYIGSLRIEASNDIETLVVQELSLIQAFANGEILSV